jgi:predicted heme/steroid binding protein
MQKLKLSWWLLKIDRIAAWFLLISILLFFLSGFGMAKGIIDINLAIKLHNNILPLITITAFTLHTSLAIRMTFKRWRIWNGFTMISLVTIYLLIFLSFSYFQLFYQKKQEVGTSETKIQNIEITKDKTNNLTTTEKVFTKEELAKYDGLNGRPAYAAIDGVVYDLSVVFRNGKHKGHEAGIESTNAFYSEHMKEILSKYPVVGKLK